MFAATTAGIALATSTCSTPVYGGPFPPLDGGAPLQTDADLVDSGDGTPASDGASPGPDAAR
jgi:hypothetical protein